jgi:hypothetical protein
MAIGNREVAWENAEGGRGTGDGGLTSGELIFHGFYGSEEGLLGLHVLILKFVQSEI